MIEVSTTIHSSIQKVWDAWTTPAHIVMWNFASAEWCCPKASVDLKVGGKFSHTMASKDGNYQFDFWGTYSLIEEYVTLEVVLEDNRKLHISFEQNGEDTIVTEQFEPENMNDVELQRSGWQAILNEFKSYVEREIQ
jgi:uncharacterized protein YndB with AHSA1/START domain